MNDKKKFQLALIFNVLLFITGLFFLLKRINFQSKLPSGPSQAEVFSRVNKAKIELYKGLPIKAGEIVLIGNSLTEGFPATEIFQNLRIKNRGIAGNTTAMVADRIADIAVGHPAHIFIEMGVNDLHEHVAVDTVVSNYKRTIETIRELSPGTAIHMQSILPVGPTYAYAEHNIEICNAQLQRLAQQYRVDWIDLFSAFYKDGGIQPSLTFDDLHLTATAYHIWASAIRSRIPSLQ